jgi:MFS superfamily sulfate permease-like transporter
MNTPYREPGPCQKCAKRKREARLRWAPEDTNAKNWKDLALIVSAATLVSWVFGGLTGGTARAFCVSAFLLVLAGLSRVRIERGIE